MKKTVKLISSIGHDGAILPSGRLLELSEELANDLIRRGRAVLATEEEMAQAAEAADNTAQATEAAQDAPKPRKRPTAAPNSDSAAEEPSKAA